MDRRTAVLLLAGIAAGCGAPTAKELTAGELGKLLEKRESLFFLDVREPEEIARLGSIKGYVNIPIGQLEGRLGEIPKDKLIITA